MKILNTISAIETFFCQILAKSYTLIKTAEFSILSTTTKMIRIQQKKSCVHILSVYSIVNSFVATFRAYSFISFVSYIIFPQPKSFIRNQQYAEKMKKHEQWRLKKCCLPFYLNKLMNFILNHTIVYLSINKL